MSASNVSLGPSFLKGFTELGKAVKSTGGQVEYVLPELPYEYNALEPVISEAQLRVHHEKHHQGYVNGLNETLEKIRAAADAGDTGAVRPLCDALAFNYGGHILHTLYWFGVQPGGPDRPDGQLAELIARDFGSFDALKTWLSAAAAKVQGSGWAVLAWDALGARLMILQTEQHHKLVGWSLIPLLVIDVWEHAYYLDYQNRRADYVNELLGIVNWQVVANRLAAVAK